MSDAESSPLLQHILVAVDASPHSQAALDAAVRIAATVDARVTGLFVEDERLRKTAKLSVATEVRAYTAPAARLDDNRLERQLRYRIQYAERLLNRLSERAGVSHRFDTVDGLVPNEVRQAAHDADLLIMGKTSTDSSRRRLGSTSRTLLATPPCPLLVLRKAVPPQRPLLLYYDGSPAAETALRLSAQVAYRETGPPIDVLLPTHDNNDADRLHDALRNRPETERLSLRPTRLNTAAGRRLSAFAKQKDGILVLPRNSSPLRTISFQQFLYEADRPLLVVP